MSPEAGSGGAVLSFKQRCKEHPPQLGCWLNLASPLASELLAGSGYDCIMIDREHSPTDHMTALGMLHAARCVGAAVLLRVPANEEAEIKRAADLGVDGIMVPQVDSAEEARRAANAAYYAPAGRRGMAPGAVRASAFGQDRRYVAEAASRLLLMCQVETASGADAAAEIAAVPGVDLLFIGPYDFSAALGFPGEPDHPQVRARIEAIEAACRASCVPVGGIPTPGRSARELIEAGYALILCGSDVAFLREGARAQLDALAEPRSAARKR